MRGGQKNAIRGEWRCGELKMGIGEKEVNNAIQQLEPWAHLKNKRYLSCYDECKR